MSDVKLIDYIVDALLPLCDTIYTEQVKQNFQTPCFYVKCINLSKKKGFDTLYNNINCFAIQYFPDSDEINAECNAMSEKLYSVLEYIGNENMLFRGSELQSELQNEMLSFFVNYDFNTYVKKERYNMETHKVDTAID